MLSKVALYVSFIVLLVFGQGAGSPQSTGNSGQSDELYDLALSDRDAFARRLTASATTDLERAQAVVGWFAANFDWTATDYKKRTVEEILERKGGNCAELARVATAVMDDLDLRMRQVREINLHVESEKRQRTAAEKFLERGNRMSVFGRRHNDHVWIEIQDRETGMWFPADPSLGIVGEDEWLAGRLGFGERFSLDPSSKDMIAPFAVFAADDDGNLTLDRTRHYVVAGFNRLYNERLQELPAWPDWVRLVGELDDKALGAFRGDVNLHTYGSTIDSLATTYERLREQYTELGQQDD